MSCLVSRNHSHPSEVFGAAAILMTRANPPVADDVAVKAAKRITELAYAAAKPT